MTPAVATALNLVIGYDAATRVVEQAVAEGRTIREVLAESGLLTTAQIDAALDLDAIARGSSS